MAKQKKRADGRYCKNVTLSNGKRKMVYGRTQAECEAAAQAIKDDDKNGIDVSNDTLVGEWAAVWFEQYKKNLRPNTARMYRQTYNRHIFPMLAELRIRDVKPVHCRSVMNSVAALSASSQHKVLITMQQLFGTALNNGLIRRNPAEGLKIGHTEAVQKTKHLSQEEQKDLLNAVKMLSDKRCELFVMLCLFCGLRKEEALGLQWTDIKKDRLEVNRAVSFSAGKTDESMQLKTKAAHRVIPLPEQLRQLVEVSQKTSIWVIPNVSGSRCTEQGFKRMWEKVHRVYPGITPHMLRHTYCTSLYKMGVDIRTAQKLLGHSSIMVTANIYTHLDDEDSISALSTINEYFKLTTG